MTSSLLTQHQSCQHSPSILQGSHASPACSRWLAFFTAGGRIPIASLTHSSVSQGGRSAMARWFTCEEQHAVDGEAVAHGAGRCAIQPVGPHALHLPSHACHQSSTHLHRDSFLQPTIHCTPICLHGTALPCTTMPFATSQSSRQSVMSLCPSTKRGYHVT